ncbi:BZ3500_MvSof-1268-A1-R1_Chr9g10660 [Microbotryum saponariae]|uniref:BZ3500_MvSof-1268-A1-R1_Chr9g10660 protein n=1 Tax=Microbotryum saponariae TaxID=289078 RepID=A0A2X0L1P4_9BASI|nr:BZ3501_MvSof-1269-A2-R1_Chr9g10408 [Microbotryum saponariae]SDA00474.1 BZ3500_MvSof-1268-A1-R1_Chr9g10660 [Microbotryum saponariae]
MACRHWASLHVVPRPSATFYEPAVVVEALQRIRDQEMPAACNIATNSSNNSLQHVLSECQPSSCFFTVSSLWSGELRLTIPWQILNGSGFRSDAFPLFHVIACTNRRRLHHEWRLLGGSLYMRLLAAADRMTETERAKAIRR